MLINKREKVGIKKLKKLKAFIDYSQLLMSMKIWKTIKKRKVLIVFDDMIADREANKKISPTVIELFLRGRKLNISLVF